MMGRNNRSIFPTDYEAKINSGALFLIHQLTRMMHRHCYIWKQSQLDAFRPARGLPLSISFSSLVKLEVNDTQVLRLLHNDLETFSLYGNVSFRGESRVKLVERILNHKNLRALNLHGISPLRYPHELFYKTSISGSLLRLSLSSLTLEKHAIVLMSRAMGENQVVKTLRLYQCTFKCLNTHAAWIWKLRGSNLQRFILGGQELGFNEFFCLSRCLIYDIEQEILDGRVTHVFTKLSKLVGSLESRKAAARQFLASMIRIGKLEVLQAHGLYPVHQRIAHRHEYLQDLVMAGCLRII